MNLIPDLSPSSPLRDGVELRYLLYVYLLSKARSEDGVVYSAYTVSDLRTRFTSFSDDLVVDAVRELIQDDLIQATPEGIILGKKVGRKVNLFSPADVSTEDYQNQIWRVAHEHVEHAVRKPLARALLTQMERLLERAFEGWRTEDFQQLHYILYTCTLEEAPRDATNKERGQINHLRKVYDPLTLFKMIAEFMLHSDLYAGRAAPTLGLLMYHRDTLHLKVKGKSKKSTDRKRLRDDKGRDDEGF